MCRSSAQRYFLLRIAIYCLFMVNYSLCDHRVRVFPKIIRRDRVKRESNIIQNIEIEVSVGSKPLHILLSENQGLDLNHGVVEWIHPDGSKTMEPLAAIVKQRKNNATQSDFDTCFFKGSISGESSSLVAVNICDGMTGFIQAGADGYIIEPLQRKFSNIESEHIVMKVLPIARDELVSNDEIREKREVGGTVNASEVKEDVLTGDEEMFTWYEVDLDEAMASQDELADLEWEGHVADKVWEIDSAAARRKSQRQKGHTVCNGPYCEYFRVKKDEAKWLETALYIDHTVIKFHGSDTVKQYILTLINIVSAIYGDPTLGANLKFVILRMIFYEDSSVDQILEDNSTVSLENVNDWNLNILTNLPKDERHDVAVWITRLNIGGPSGYAPVSGVCDPERSCSLNRDEGLSSAFILAHELGHILGLSHDGDLGAGNSCKKESNEGSVMAPMVAATFSYFHWSSCSAGEYHFKSNEWKCMKNKPKKTVNYTLITEKIEYEYSLDDQCRMEFDRGFSFCRSFQLPDPCEHLWCAHHHTPQLCKTKKGPPMDGTACGREKWCVNGRCESTSKNIARSDGLKHNALAGGWGSWSRWGVCSRTCGGGVSFRTRRCNNPRPSYGGEPCRGKGEEFKLCNIYRCIKGGDFRAKQCQSEFYIAAPENKPEVGQTWLPFEHNDYDHKCKLACFNRFTKEYFNTGENVIDGTPCSYDHPSNICVQGQCIQVGCDRILDSPLQEDQCGICAGDGTKCSVQVRKIRKRINKDFTKIFALPRGARHIEVEEKSGNNVTLLMKERKTSIVFLDGSSIKSSHYATISEGTKFLYQEKGSRKIVTGRGPLQGAVVVGLKGTSRDEGDIVIKYITEDLEDTHSSRHRYEWQIMGWSRCSKDCGGGVQRLIIRCFDSVTGQRIKKRLCGPKRSRPRSEKRSCNTFSCETAWVAGEWEHCSASCGKTGTKYREVFCLPKYANHTDQIWKNMVDVRHCTHPKPNNQEECNRFPCPHYWEEKEWTECSSTCDIGIKTLQYQCPAPTPQTCGLYPLQRSICNLEGCAKPCSGDKSPFCEEKVMMRYCKIPSYNEKCCKSCSSFRSN